MNFLIISTLLAAANAMPSYIAVPADQIAFLDLSSLRRVPRQTLSPPPPPPVLPQALYEDNYQPIPIQNYQQSVALAPPPAPEVQQRIQLQAQSEAADVPAHYEERAPDFGEYVDFGAHTGDNGAFGWYADYPINNHDDSHYRK
ncbi:uncharacterized protein LOC121735426 [Aricia agestis]|uniref:uncharacterized protein LOC121735426 n=1 Tax=Aricia agestis TaxID=91739 RepID=UPI001C20209E|nr:uncharacterized protein LOC121735426 [Aricia agestis]